MINLSHGGSFSETNLVAHIQKSGRHYIIQGQQKCAFNNHTKPNSLDFWLRKNFATNPNTKQADGAIISALVKTGLFSVHPKLLCPDSGRMCKGIVLTANAKQWQGGFMAAGKSRGAL